MPMIPRKVYSLLHVTWRGRARPERRYFRDMPTSLGLALQDARGGDVTHPGSP